MIRRSFHRHGHPETPQRPVLCGGSSGSRSEVLCSLVEFHPPRADALRAKDATDDQKFPGPPFRRSWRDWPIDCPAIGARPVTHPVTCSTGTKPGNVFG